MRRALEKPSHRYRSCGGLMAHPGDPMNRPGERSSPHRGFSLIELLLVLAVIGILSAIAVPSYSSYREKVKIAACILGIKVIEQAIQGYQVEANDYPASLAEIGMGTMKDPWGNPYQYLKIAGLSKKDKAKLRKDHFMVPINTDFDLYSMGKDGKSAAPLTAEASRDDVIRASDGQFVGKASDF